MRVCWSWGLRLWRLCVSIEPTMRVYLSWGLRLWRLYVDYWAYHEGLLEMGTKIVETKDGPEHNRITKQICWNLEQTKMLLAFKIYMFVQNIYPAKKGRWRHWMLNVEEIRNSKYEYWHTYIHTLFRIRFILMRIRIRFREYGSDSGSEQIPIFSS